jgi:predicted ester cyclase
MSETNKVLARRWFEEVWNRKNTAAIDEMFHTNGQSKGLPDPDSVIQGPTNFKEVHRNFLAAFPDLHVSLENQVAEGDWVATRWIATMTHLGDGLGYTPTGKKLSMNGFSFSRFQNGQIVEGWNQMDFTRLRLQLEGKA